MTPTELITVINKNANGLFVWQYNKVKSASKWLLGGVCLNDETVILTTRKGFYKLVTVDRKCSHLIIATLQQHNPFIKNQKELEVRISPPPFMPVEF